jgi:hypothetical protein
MYDSIRFIGTPLLLKMKKEKQKGPGLKSHRALRDARLVRSGVYAIPLHARAVRPSGLRAPQQQQHRRMEVTFTRRGVSYNSSIRVKKNLRQVRNAG